MNSKSIRLTEQLVRHFPEMTELSDPDIKDILDGANTHSFPPEKLVSARGSKSELFVLVMTGSIRVQVVTESGREVILYHVRPGEGCILTTSSLITGEPFPAEGITNTDTEVLALTRAVFDKAIDESGAFRRLVFSNLGQRLSDVISRIEQLCSPSIDRHLADTLVRLSSGNGSTVVKTHQELAGDIGTVREVVSRHLKRFENSGWIRLGRGSISIEDSEALAAMAKQ